MTATIGTVTTTASRRVLALAIMPLFSIATGAIWIWARFGSDLRFWSADPEYAYLLNGINIATAVPPAHFDHPGTPLQILNGLVVVAFRWLSGGQSRENSIAESVVATPEAHLTVLAFILVTALAAAMFAVGWRVSSVVGLPLGILAQTGPFALSSGYAWLSEHFIRNFPEAMLLPVLMAAVAVIAPAVLRSDRHAPDNRIALGLGLCLGTAAAVKINAWPIVLALPWVLVHWRFALRTYLVAGVTAVLWLIPVVTQGRQMLAFWLASGGGFTDVFLSFEPLRALLSPSLWVAGLFMISAIGLGTWLVIGAVRGRFATMIDGNERLVSYTAITAVLVWVQVSMLLSRSPWWIIPVLPLLGFGLVTVLVLFGRWRPRSEGLIRVSALVLVIAMATPSALDSIRTVRLTSALQPGPIAEFLRQQQPDLLIVDRGIAWSNVRFSDECISLHFGDFFAGGIAVREIAQRCPTVSLVYSGADPTFTDVGPHDAETTGRPALSCATVADQLSRGAAVFLLANATPDLPNASLDILASEDGWTLSTLQSVTCGA